MDDFESRKTSENPCCGLMPRQLQYKVPAPNQKNRLNFSDGSFDSLIDYFAFHHFDETDLAFVLPAPLLFGETGSSSSSSSSVSTSDVRDLRVRGFFSGSAT